MSKAAAVKRPRTATRVSRIGIFGGTFDPVHRGHLKLLIAARKALALDRVFVVPSYITPLKERSPAPVIHRLAMLRLALKPLCWAKISRFEVARRRVSYTVDTLRHFKKRFPEAELFFIAGGDAARSFSRWKDPRGILGLCRIAVAARGRALPSRLKRGFIALPMPRTPESSTAARRAAAAGALPEESMPQGVARYAATHGLYGELRGKAV